MAAGFGDTAARLPVFNESLRRLLAVQYGVLSRLLCKCTRLFENHQVGPQKYIREEAECCCLHLTCEVRW